MKELAPLRLKFSHEELITLLELTGLPMIAGIGENPFDDLAENVINLLKQVGLRVLLARNIVEIQSDDQMVVDEQLVKLLFFCAHPQKLMTLTWQENNAPIQFEYVYQVPGLMIIQNQVYPGVHELIVYATKKDALDRLLARVTCSNNTPIINKFSAPRSIFDVANAFAVSVSRFKLKALLSSQDIDENIVDDFLQAMFAGRKMLFIHATEPEKKAASENDKVFLFSDKGCWLLEGFSDSARTDILITPLTATDFEHQLFSILKY